MVLCRLEGELQLGGSKRSGSIYAVVFLLLANKVVDEYTHSQGWLLLRMKYQIPTELGEVPALAQDPQPLKVVEVFGEKTRVLPACRVQI